MPPQSFIYYYHNVKGVAMCEISIRSSGKPTFFLLGINFLENYLQLYDIRAKQMCLKPQIDIKRGWKPIPFPYAPKVLPKLALFGWTLGGFILLCLIIVVVLYYSVPPPGERAPAGAPTNSPK